MPIQFTHALRILAPILRDLDEQAQKNLRVQKRFQFLARFRPDFLQHCAFVPDKDFLLCIALDVKGSLDANQPWVFFKLVDEDSQRVRQFVVQGSDGLLADDFSSEESLGLIGDLVFRKIRLAIGQMAEDFVQQVVAAGSLERGEGNDGGKVEFLAEAFDQRQELRFRNCVDFI